MAGLGTLATFGGLAGVGAATLAPKTAHAQQTGGSGLAAAVTGTINDLPVTGTMTITDFADNAGQLVANGFVNLSGSDLGTVIVPFTDLAVSSPLTTQQQATCEILRLELDGLFLNLLGLEIDLAPVLLTIVANPAGGLLGQLLCAIANLLSGDGPLRQLIGALNRLIRLLS
jgi:hypothetical protein